MWWLPFRRSGHVFDKLAELQHVTIPQRSKSTHKKKPELDVRTEEKCVFPALNHLGSALDAAAEGDVVDIANNDHL